VGVLVLLSVDRARISPPHFRLRTLLPIALTGVSLALALVALPARANGRFPNAQQLREIDDDTVVVVGTYGLLQTTNGGADFSYQCEAVLFGAPVSATMDPLLEVLPDGAIVTGSRHGLTVSRDGGCRFEFEPSLPRNWAYFGLEPAAGAESGQVIDVCRRGGAADAPVLALVTMLDSAGRATEHRIYQADAGGAFRPVGVPIPSTMMDFAFTIDVAPSDPERFYVTGTAANDPVFIASDDGGASYRASSPVFEDADSVLGAYIGAVSPADPDRVYLRVARRVATTDGLYARDDSLGVTRDGGTTFIEVLRAGANLLGFALSPDGNTVLSGYGDPRTDETVSSPDAVGIYAANADELSFGRIVADIDVSCLRYGERGLYACAVERDPLALDPAGPADFHLGVYRGGGLPNSVGDFAPLLDLRNVRGPPPERDGAPSACAEAWRSTDPSAPVATGVCAQFNACDADPAAPLAPGALVCGDTAPPGGAGAPGDGDGGPLPETDPGCGCRTAPLMSSSPRGEFLVLCAVLALARRLRRRAASRGASRYLMLKLFETVTGSPENAGMRARRKTPATHPPTAVPAKGAEATFALVTRPLGAKVTCALPLPVGPPGLAQLAALPAACVSAT